MLGIKGVSKAVHKGSLKCWAQREYRMLGIKGVSNAGHKKSLKCWL